jgi:hypothetical protein
LLSADGRIDPEAVLPAIPQSPQAVFGEERNDEADEPERIPPDVQRVAKRALCLAAVAGRALLEIEQMPRHQTESERQRLLGWVGELALETELESEELNLLRQPVGTLTRQATVDAGWRLEGLGVLSWALGGFELPAYDALVDVATLLPAVGFLELNKSTALLASPSLRSREELGKLQKQCFALHWRLRNFSLDKKPLNFRTFARECWFGPLDVSWARFSADDLALGDVPIGKAPPEEFQKALSSANERHLAINWLADGGEIYSETDTST